MTLCPLCRRRLLPSHHGPLHLQAEDISMDSSTNATANSNQNENDNSQRSRIDSAGNLSGAQPCDTQQLSKDTPNRQQEDVAPMTEPLPTLPKNEFPDNSSSNLQQTSIMVTDETGQKADLASMNESLDDLSAFDFPVGQNGNEQISIVDAKQNSADLSDAQQNAAAPIIVPLADLSSRQNSTTLVPDLFVDQRGGSPQTPNNVVSMLAN